MFSFYYDTMGTEIQKLHLCSSKSQEKASVKKRQNKKKTPTFVQYKKVGRPLWQIEATENKNIRNTYKHHISLEAKECASFDKAYYIKDVYNLLPWRQFSSITT